MGRSGGTEGKRKEAPRGKKRGGGRNEMEKEKEGVDPRGVLTYGQFLLERDHPSLLSSRESIKSVRTSIFAAFTKKKSHSLSVPYIPYRRNVLFFLEKVLKSGTR